jgi:hypothetical protein
MTHHKIIAADWQIKAAERGRLGAVIVPLEQYFSYPITKIRHNGLGTAIYSDDFNMGFVHNLFSAGDRLYLAEQWCENGRITGEPPIENCEEFLIRHESCLQKLKLATRRNHATRSCSVLV